MQTNITKQTINYLKTPRSYGVNNTPIFILYDIYTNNSYMNKKSLHRILNMTPTFYQTEIKKNNKSKSKNKNKNKNKNELLDCLYTNGLIKLGLVNVVMNPKNVNQIILKPSKLGKAFITHFKKDIIDKYVKLGIFLNISCMIVTFLVVCIIIAYIIILLKTGIRMSLFIPIIGLIILTLLCYYSIKFDKMLLHEYYSLNKYIKENDIINFFKKELSSKREINNDITMLMQYKFFKNDVNI